MAEIIPFKKPLKRTIHRYIERENLKFCMIYKCPHLSWGTCTVMKCTLRKEENNVY